MIAIKKRVSLEFLGEEYKDSYIRLKALPVSQFETLQKELEALSEDGKAITTMLDKLKDNFVDGKCPDEEGKLVDIEAKDLDSFDIETVIKCWQTYTGQVPDPKDSSQ